MHGAYVHIHLFTIQKSNKKQCTYTCVLCTCYNCTISKDYPTGVHVHVYLNKLIMWLSVITVNLSLCDYMYMYMYVQYWSGAIARYKVNSCVSTRVIGLPPLLICVYVFASMYKSICLHPMQLRVALYTYLASIYMYIHVLYVNVHNQMSVYTCTFSIHVRIIHKFLTTKWV